MRLMMVNLEDFSNGCLCLLAEECSREYDRLYGEVRNEELLNRLWWGKYDTILDSALLNISFPFECEDICVEEDFYIVDADDEYYDERF